MNEQEYATLGHVKASKYRKQVVTYLSDNGESIPTEIADGTGIDQSSVSHALTKLREHDLVELKVPEETQKGRIYGITEWGEEIVGEIDG